ncbi:hypothetical protein AJ78_07928 [Emergomyces pasteurianus Ep9510]|uniref:Uncharacterized protein n=1 Tax=Emergomyces pasteurianus Ep9510 TaxID=1447872 RepID=A0A1J9P4G1_9EURO|nr:hypothetical protein AJ78_07928 [Emergomyces pasteurianus Ep9510]
MVIGISALHTLASFLQKESRYTPYGTNVSVSSSGWESDYVDAATGTNLMGQPRLGSASASLIVTHAKHQLPGAAAAAVERHQLSSIPSVLPILTTQTLQLAW